MIYCVHIIAPLYYFVNSQNTQSLHRVFVCFYQCKREAFCGPREHIKSLEGCCTFQGLKSFVGPCVALEVHLQIIQGLGHRSRGEAEPGIPFQDRGKV